MLFATPPLDATLSALLSELDDLRRRLGARTAAPTPWLGSLRRQMRASSAESSIEIEGFSVPPEEALGLASGADPLDPEDGDRMALACYGRAMDHVGVMARDPGFSWSERAVLDLHFDACHFQRDRDPGLYRQSRIEVTNPVGGGPAYVGPPHGDVPALMGEMVDWLERGDLDAHVAVRAAMAHLHLVSIHPFRDGNGRVSRIVQSLVLALDGLLAPELGSIEEYLGRHTDRYYATLQAVQGGGYRPERDATPWIELCLRAHVAQARDRLATIERAARRWDRLEAIVRTRGWPDRMVVALEQSLFAATDRATYAGEADVSPATASADLRRLLDAELLVQKGQGRSTRYVASDALRADVDRALAGADEAR